MMRVCYIFVYSLLTIVVIGKSNCAENHLESWERLENLTQRTLHDLGDYIDHEYSQYFNSSGISQPCSESISHFVKGLKAFDINYVQMADSWGKLSSGLMLGSWTNLGSLDECVSLDMSQYCLLNAKMPLGPSRRQEGIFRPIEPSSMNFTSQVFTRLEGYIHFFRHANLTVGVCMPRECTNNEMNNIFSAIVQHHGINMEIDVDLCQHRSKSNPILFREGIALTIIVTVIILNILGVIYHEHSFFSHFNVLENFNRLFKPAKLDRRYYFLDSVKFFTMLTVISAHVAWAFQFASFNSIFNSFNVWGSPMGASLLTSSYASDTYFLIAGLEMMTFFLSDKRSFSLSAFLFVRWARFCILIGWTICIYLIVFSNHVRDLIGGPFWSHLSSAASIPTTCGKKWLNHLLLIAHYSNSVDDWNTCIMPDWFLEADFLFSLMFLIVLWPHLKGSRMQTILTAVSLILLGAAIIGLVIGSLGLQETWLPFDFMGRSSIAYLMLLHAKPWGHISSYFSGVLLAFILTPKKPKLFKWSHLTLMWSLWITSFVFVNGYEMLTNYNIHTFSREIQIIYSMTVRIFWSIYISWPLYCLHYRLLPDRVTAFFGSAVFTPLARINLSVLFVNEMVIRLRNGAQNSLNDMSLVSILSDITPTVLMYTYFCSFLFASIVDGPAISIMKSFFSPKSY